MRIYLGMVAGCLFTTDKFGEVDLRGTEIDDSTEYGQFCLQGQTDHGCHLGRESILVPEGPSPNSRSGSRPEVSPLRLLSRCANCLVLGVWTLQVPGLMASLRLGSSRRLGHPMKKAGNVTRIHNSRRPAKIHTNCETLAIGYGSRTPKTLGPIIWNKNSRASRIIASADTAQAKTSSLIERRKLLVYQVACA